MTAELEHPSPRKVKRRWSVPVVHGRGGFELGFHGPVEQKVHVLPGGTGGNEGVRFRQELHKAFFIKKMTVYSTALNSRFSLHYFWT